MYSTLSTCLTTLERPIPNEYDSYVIFSKAVVTKKGEVESDRSERQDDCVSSKSLGVNYDMCIIIKDGLLHGERRNRGNIGMVDLHHGGGRMRGKFVARGGIRLSLEVTC